MNSPDSQPPPKLLVKIVACQRYRDDLLSGKLYMNPLGWFAGHSDGGGLRGDRFEGASHVLPHEGVEISINGGPSFAPRLTAPITVWDPQIRNLNAYCMFAFGLPTDPPDTTSDPEALRRSLEIPPECFALGGIAVVIEDSGEFLRRVKVAAKNSNFIAHARRVQYMNLMKGHHFHEPSDAPFVKDVEFAHQREFRITLDRRQEIGRPFSLEIGDITDISAVTTPHDFNRLISIEATIPGRDGSQFKIPLP